VRGKSSCCYDVRHSLSKFRRFVPFELELCSYGVVRNGSRSFRLAAKHIFLANKAHHILRFVPSVKGRKEFEKQTRSWKLPTACFNSRLECFDSRFANRSRHSNLWMDGRTGFFKTKTSRYKSSNIRRRSLPLMWVGDTSSYDTNYIIRFCACGSKTADINSNSHL
jgi:hypothetical protein